MVKKSAGVMKMGPETPEDDVKPSLHLSGKHAKKLAKHKIGQKVKLTIHGKKVSHSIGSGGGHNVCIECSKVYPFEGGVEEKDETMGE